MNGIMSFVRKDGKTPSIVSISRCPSTNVPYGHDPAQLLVGRTAHQLPSAELWSCTDSQDRWRDGNFVPEQRPLPAAMGWDEKGEVRQWLEQVVRDQPIRPFLLPSTSAGPDHMFLLCNKSAQPVQRIFYAVQVCNRALLISIPEADVWCFP